MKRILAISVFALTACFASAKNAAPAVEMIDIPTEIAAAGYNYLLRFPAGEVKGMLDAMEAKIKVAADGKKETVSLPKESMESLYKALMNDQVVQLTIGLQQVLQPQSMPEAAPVE